MHDSFAQNVYVFRVFVLFNLKCFVKDTNYETDAPHYVTFSVLPLLPVSWAQEFSLVTYRKTSSMCVLSLRLEVLTATGFRIVGIRGGVLCQREPTSGKISVCQ
jgi:hypothetical protein